MKGRNCWIRASLLSLKAHAGPPWRGWGDSAFAIWKGSCLVGNDPLRPKLGRLEPKGYVGRYLYCQVAFWAKLYSPILKNPKLPSSTPRGK